MHTVLDELERLLALRDKALAMWDAEKRVWREGYGPEDWCWGYNEDARLRNVCDTHLPSLLAAARALDDVGHNGDGFYDAAANDYRHPHQDATCPWCGGSKQGDDGKHAVDCPRQAALAPLLKEVA